MHYGNLVIIRPPEDGQELNRQYVESAVEDLMKLGFQDWWDWYQIGGRWTGALDGYDPESDPALQETCRVCNGEGKLNAHTLKGYPWMKPEQVGENCQHCNGAGKSMVWPTQWGFRMGDVLPVEKLTHEHYRKFYRVVRSHGAFSSEKPPLDWLKEEYREPSPWWWTATNEVVTAACLTRAPTRWKSRWSA